MKFKRSLPFFEVLLKASPKNRITVLKSFPNYVVDDLVEILYNIVLGKVSAPIKKIIKYKKPLLDLKNSKSKTVRRKILYKQNGGFLGALIPIVASIAGGLISRL